MRISLEWLNNYINLSDFTAEQIAEMLTSLGLEVEEIVSEKALDDKIIVGTIVKTQKHPNADSLKLCDVSIGHEQNLSIVCGAPNAKEGLVVAVASIGAVLPDGFKIKKSNIRSVRSEGMMCSEKELGLSENHEGLLELSNGVQLGTPVSQILKTQDTILDLSITPNRSDCLSYMGIARELSAKLQRKISYPQCILPSNDLKTSDSIKLKIDDDFASRRIIALYAKNIKVIPSPSWLQKRLERSGMRALNLIVDLTNYVMLEMGQPLHAYDIRAVEDKTLQVRFASKGESLLTLDNSDIDLTKEDIVISDSKKVLGLAGVMGGLNSEVKDDTTEIILEAAQFCPAHIRKTAKKFALHSEASHRFERQIDISNIANAAKRFAFLLNQIAQEEGLTELEVSGELLELVPETLRKKRVALRLSRLRKILALSHIKMEKCINHLEGLGIQLLDKTDDRMLFEIPFWRHDIDREIDLIEEVGRLEGFDNIPYHMPYMEITPTYESPFVSFQDDCRLFFATQNLSEIISYPFFREKDFQNLNMNKDHPLWCSVQLENALNDEASYMQTSLMLGLLKSTLQNRNRANKSSKIFEIGRGFFDSKISSTKNIESFVSYKDFFRFESFRTQNEKKDDTSKIIERNLLAGIIDSPFQEKTWLDESKVPNFFHVKQLISKFLSAFNISNISWHLVNEKEVPFLHPKAGAQIFSNEIYLGYLGELNPYVARAFGLGDSIPVVFELDLEAVFSSRNNKINVKNEISKFPSVSRDLAFVVDKNLSYETFNKTVFSTPKIRYLDNLELFDQYEGNGIADGCKSLAARYTFKSQDKTLTDKEINKEVESLSSWLAQKIAAKQR